MSGGHRADELETLEATGAVRLVGPFARPDDAWSETRAVLGAVEDTGRDLEVIGDFVLPPADGPPSRAFQTLHFDFGLPLVPVLPADIARFTALHVPAGARPTSAATRLVPLAPLFATRSWPSLDELLSRFAGYGHSHGAWDDQAGYVEGSLARIVEAALGDTPQLPSVKTCDGFLCGSEFASLEAEERFFAQRGLRPAAVELSVCVNPGELVIFDNHRVAHGRRGSRSPGELRQRVFGHRDVSVTEQMEIRDRVLAAFALQP